MIEHDLNHSDRDPQPFVLTVSSEAQPVVLRTGATCWIHAIGPGDESVLRTCFAGLSAASRRLRFFGAKQALTDADLATLTNTDGRDHLAFAAVRHDAQGQVSEVLGIARCVRVAPGAQTAELAMAVIDRAQGQGLGGILLEHLRRAAQAQGIDRFHCEVLAENDAMRALAKRLGGRARWLDDGTLSYECPLREVTTTPAVPAHQQAATCPPRPARAFPSPTWTQAWERIVRTGLATYEVAAQACYHQSRAGA
ncbi:GNAT family N-acetyltransferase [Thiocapsa imhoffii]|nr:GNAT family N-acetyltransferase [Thiocapsa imhoffii]